MTMATDHHHTRDLGLAGGFSLMEITMVLVILSVAAAVAVPRYNRSITRYRVESAARRVVADLEYARNHARQTSQTVMVEFDLGNEGVKIPLIPSLDNQPFYITNLGGDPYRVDVANANFGGDNFVAFDGYGGPDSGGTVDVRAGSLSITVTLDAVTGKASVP